LAVSNKNLKDFISEAQLTAYSAPCARIVVIEFLKTKTISDT